MPAPPRRRAAGTLALRLATALIAALMVTAPGQARAADARPEPVVAVLIDDVGYDRRNDLRILGMPVSVGIAVLPHSPNGAEAAARARRQGRDVLLHQPLTARNGKSLGPGGIEMMMDARAMATVLRGNLLWLGGAVGLNNHMGSAFTANPRAVGRLTRVLKESFRDLFIIDSRTDSQTVFEKTARKARLRTVRRNVFLDHEETETFVNRQLDELVRVARQHGSALAIGHPKTTTLRVLDRRLPKLGVKLIPVSELVRRRTLSP